MSAWTSKRLGDCVRMVSGGTPSKNRPDYWGGDIPWISAKDMKTPRLQTAEDYVSDLGAKSSTRIVGAGAVLVLVRGMTLHHSVPVGITVQDTAFNQDVKALIVGEGMDPEFLFYALSAREAEMLKLVDSAGHGTGRIHTYLLSDLRIDVPEIDVQRRIGSLLSTLDRKVEANTAAIATIDAAIAAAGDAALARGGVHTTLESIATLTRGAGYAKDELAPSEVALVSLKAFQRNGGFRSVGLKPFTGRYRSDQIVRSGDSVVAVTDITQNADIVGRTVRPSGGHHFTSLVASMDAVILRPSTSGVPSEFLFSVLSTERFREHCRGRANGTTVLHLAPREILAFDIDMPARDVIEWTARVVAGLWRAADALVAEIDTALHLRRVLLEQLASGTWYTAAASPRG